MTNRSSSWWVEDACVPIWNTFDLIRRKHCGDCSSRPFKWNAMNDLCFDKFSPRWRACHAPYPRFIDPLLNRLWAVVISSRTIFTFPMPFPKLQWTPSLVLSLSSTLEASFKNATLEQGQPLGFFEILQFFFSFLKFLINSQIGKIPYSSAKSRIFPESFNTRLYFILIYGVSCTLDLSPQVQYMMYRHLHRWLCCQDCLIVSIDLKKKKLYFAY